MSGSPAVPSERAGTIRSAAGCRWLVALVLGLAAIVVYGPSLPGPLLFDDIPSIVDNPTIRRLWPLPGPLAPPGGGITVAGRPVLNLSLAANYAIGGTRAEGYHVLNLLIHFAAALLVFGLVRRTASRLGGPGPRDSTGHGPSPLVLGFLSALIWMLHPLQTESVTYVIQRAESLMGLFYLLALYTFSRAVEPPDAVAGGRSFWLGCSVAACGLGMATKEVMVSAPLIVLLYDRTFVAGTFGAAWRLRWRYYAALGATWIILGYLVLKTGNRGGTMGLGTGAPTSRYWLMQARGLLHYLRLVGWPRGLVFDYGATWPDLDHAHWPSVLLAGLAIAVTLAALGSPDPRRRAAGFLGAWFFALLAPTSLLPSNRQVLAEHRLYLPLVPLVILALLALAALVAAAGAPGFGSLNKSRGPRVRPGTIEQVAFAGFALLWAGALGLAAAERNHVYADDLALWQDTAAKAPGNPWAHNNLGKVYLQQPGQTEAAITEFETALRLKPDLAEAHNNLGSAWSRSPGHFTEALEQFQIAVRLAPSAPEAHNNLGSAWLNVPGHGDDAIKELEAALQLDPSYAEAHYNLGNAWLQVPGRLAEAIAQFQEAARLRPDLSAVHNNLGYALNAADRPAEAIAEYETALRLQPDYWEAHFNLALALLKAGGRIAEAKAELEAVLQLQPENAAARDLLARLSSSP